MGLYWKSPGEGAHFGLSQPRYLAHFTGSGVGYVRHIMTLLCHNDVL